MLFSKDTNIVISMFLLLHEGYQWLLVIFCGQKPVTLSIPQIFVPVNNFKIKSKVKSQLQVGLLSGLEVNQKRITT